MICQFCETEYPAGTERCAKCGAELVAALPPESDEIVLEPLAELSRRRELELLVARLEAARIPYVVQCGTALAMQEMQALHDTARRGQWLARVLVVSSRHEEAAAELAAAAEDLAEEPEEAWEEEPDDELDDEQDFAPEEGPEEVPDDEPARPERPEPLTLASLAKILRK